MSFPVGAAARRWLGLLAWPSAGALMALPFLSRSLEWMMLVAPLAWLALIESRQERVTGRAYLLGVTFVAAATSFLASVNPLVVLGSGLYFGLFVGFGLLVARLLRHRAGLPAWLAFALCVPMYEALLLNVTFWPVTWLNLGHAAWRCHALMQLAELGGPSLVSCVVVLVPGALHAMLCAVIEGGWRGVARPRALVPAAVALVAVGVAWGWGTWRIRDVERELRDRAGAGVLRVALVQGNVPQHLKFDPAQAPFVVRKHVQGTLVVPPGSVDLVAWPESVATYMPEKDAVAREFLGELARERGVALLIGAVGVNPGLEPPRPSNSAFLFSKSGEISGRSDKRVLVPPAETLLFIDHVPFLRDPIVRFLSRALHFHPFLLPGSGPVVLEVNGAKIGSLICYDDTVPEPADDLREAGVAALVTLSNEAWFLDWELDQHLAMATVRCIETRLPMARATNTGLTVTIDPAGRITRELDRNVDAVLVGELPLARVGAVPAWVRSVARWAFTLLALGLAAAALLRRRDPRT